MRFLQPDMAHWLLAIPLAFACWFLYVQAKRRFRQRAAIGPQLERISRLSTSSRDVAILVAAVVALGMLVLAMMRPQILFHTQVPEYERHDLILILDRSASMYAQDIRPSRFSRAVDEIRSFLKRKPDTIDRVALVGFAGSSLVLSHLTSDLNNLLFYLDWIEEDEQTYFGTDIGAALNGALEMTQKDGRPTPKIYVILSDGEDYGMKLPPALTAVRKEGSRVHTIGIGTEAEVPIPTVESGRATFLRDERGRMLTTRFSGNTLTKIAAVTGGRYFRSVAGNELAAAMADIVSAERKLIGWSTSAQYRDLHQEALLVAALAACALVMKM